MKPARYNDFLPGDCGEMMQASTKSTLHSPIAGFLSYLIPGLGQIYQGRVLKGFLFLFCIYTLFFYGQYHGKGSVTIDNKVYRVDSNVYIADSTGLDPNVPSSLPTWAQHLYNRPQFVGQFWVGVAAWPAIWQYLTYDKNAIGRAQADLEDLQARANDGGDGIEQQVAAAENRLDRLKRGDRFLGNYQRQPSEEAVGAVETSEGKRYQLAWVFTVIAGVLNIMVIYDAVAGPAFQFPTQPSLEKVGV
jgi:hypothetical protein